MAIGNKHKGLKFEINLMFNAKLATPQIEFFNLGVCRSLSRRYSSHPYTHMLAEVRVKKPFSTEKEGSKCESLLAMLRMSACGASSPWSSYQTLSWN